MQTLVSVIINLRLTLFGEGDHPFNNFCNFVLFIFIPLSESSSEAK